jgi:hypothetical protein
MTLQILPRPADETNVHYRVLSRPRKRAICAVLCSVGLASIVFHATSAQDPKTLRSASTFANIVDRSARSRALFNEAAKVITIHAA